MIREDHPDQGSYARAIKKLDETYWNQDLHVQNLMHKLRSLPKMDNNIASKVNEFATESLALMEQLENLLGVNKYSERPIFLMFAEILVKKFNTEAKQMWVKLKQDDVDEKNPLGHTLTIKDLKNVILKTRTAMSHRDFMKAFDEDHSSKSNDEIMETTKKAKVETEEETGEEDYQSFVETNTKQKQDPCEGDKCIVPFCGKTLSRGPKADGEHLYISKCPQLRRLPFETVNMWFKFEELSCDHCFSGVHSSQDCQFTNIKCKKVVKDGENTRRCGGSHHMALHNPRKHGIAIQVPKAENQSKNEAKED